MIQLLPTAEQAAEHHARTAARQAALFRPSPTPEPSMPPESPAAAAPPPCTTTTAATKRWAIVELYGRAALAGAMSEELFGGDTFIRVDVPEVTWQEEEFLDGRSEVHPRTIPAHTKLFGAKAIYSMALVDEAAALAFAHQARHMPMKRFTMLEALRSLSAQDLRALIAGLQSEG